MNGGPPKHTATRAGRRWVTLADVARAAGVSLATASRTLNGSARSVRESSRIRVEEVAARLGYRTNFTAQAVARGAARTVALMVRDIRARYFAEIAQGVMETAAESDLVVTIIGGEAYEDAQLERIRGLRGLQPTAIILADHRFHDPVVRPDLLTELESYRAMDVGVAVIGADDLPYPSVVFRDEEGAAELARLLVNAGYRRPLLIGGSTAVPGVTRRMRGLRTGFARAGVRLRLGPDGDLTRDGGYQAALRIPRRTLTATDLLVCINDTTAFGAAAALRELGITIGEQIAVSGFDDIPGADDIRPALTTVRLPLSDAGARALTLAISSEPDAAARLPVEVIPRASTPGTKPRPSPTTT
jgi:LacI family transcriptional regulator